MPKTQVDMGSGKCGVGQPAAFRALMYLITEQFPPFREAQPFRDIGIHGHAEIVAVFGWPAPCSASRFFKSSETAHPHVGADLSNDGRRVVRREQSNHPNSRISTGPTPRCRRRLETMPNALPPSSAITRSAPTAKRRHRNAAQTAIECDRRGSGRCSHAATGAISIHDAGLREQRA
jgi:hypothetical protein